MISLSQRIVRRELPSGATLRIVHPDPPECPYCNGRGWIPWQGRVLSRDPQDWDSCDKCEGTGVRQ